MLNRNKDLKLYIQSKDVPFWRVAEALGIADTSFSRLLRYELSEERKKEIMDIADKLSKE